jgi:type IV secretory pathway TraG/TraD family ATPase VirD4
VRSTLLTRLCGRWLPTREYPIAVVDFTAPEQRYAAGYTRIRCSPIRGAEDFTVAHRRAVSLVSGVDAANPAQQQGSDNDKFWRDSAAEVLAAWLHAAALSGRDIDDLLAWNDDLTDPTPRRILRDDPRATRSALTNLGTHLDPAADKTTSGVRRYLTLAVNSLATDDARELCGTTTDTQFDMCGFIEQGGTLYLLTDASRADRARPLLSLIAGEMFLAAATVALSTPQRRLPQPFIAALDELRYAVTIPNLPYVANALRKFGIGYVYAIQNATQEDRVYGADAPALRAAAGVSIYGGIDIDSAREISDRAGPTPVVTATRGTRGFTLANGQHTPAAERRSEHIQSLPALTISDQQQLPDGAAVVVARGLAPFFLYSPDFRNRRSLRRKLDREAATVARAVAIARERDLAVRRFHSAATVAGATFQPPSP